MPSFPVTGKVALVTGAMRGIGFETARALHARGAAVALADIDAAGAEAASRRIGGDRVISLGVDVRDEAAVVAAVERTVARFGGLDVVVANAGIAPPPRTVLRMDPGMFDRVLDVNLHGVVHTVRAALPQIVLRRGHVVVVSSVYAFTNGVLQSPYAMAKAGVEQLGRALRVELQPHGASATVAYFGFVATQMVADAYADPITQRLDRTIPLPLRKTIHPSVAAAGIVDGIERRAAHVILPRRWEVLRRLRGFTGPAADAISRRHPVLQETLRTADAAPPPTV
jgi:NAD(P)-dependent dehydrogenase (short-subunit alcohol dehydrogenase family)